MSDVLGYDCDGKALYAGDAVLLLPCTFKLLQPLCGRSATILAVSRQHSDGAYLDLPHPVKGRAYCWAFKDMLKLQSDFGKQEPEKATGWKPVRECA